MDAQFATLRTAPFLLAGVGLSAFTSGTIASLSLVAVPVILSNTTNAAILTSWRHTLGNGVRVCPPFAVAATVAHLINVYLNRNSSTDCAKYSAIAAVSTIAIVPFTMFFMASTNEALSKREQAALGTSTGVEAGSLELVKKWGRLNMTRSFLPAIGAVIACFAL